MHRPLSTLIAGLIIALFGLVSFTYGGFNLYRYWQFEGPIAHASGQVDRLFQTESHHRGHAVSYLIDYHYDIVDSSQLHATSQITQATWSTLHPGATIPVKYLPQNPTYCRIDLPTEDQWQWKRAWGFIFNGTVMMGVGLCVALFLRTKSLR